MVFVLRAVTLFLSTPSARRATEIFARQNNLRVVFLSTPSARRATTTQTGVSTRVLISIHALREEGDTSYGALNSEEFQFLSTPSARRATFSVTGFHQDDLISIHALREEGDRFPPKTGSGG